MIRQLKDITCMLQAMECCFWFDFVKRMVPLCTLFVSFKVYSSWFMKLLLILLVSHCFAVPLYRGIYLFIYSKMTHARRHLAAV